MVEGYLQDREQLRLALLLVDCRIPPTRDDVMMKEWLDYYKINKAVVLTKADKLSRNRLIQSVERAKETLGTDELIPFSAVTGLGRNLILKMIQAAVS